MTKEIIGFILILLTVATASEQDTETPASAKTPVPVSLTALYEAVLRYQIKSWELTADSYCVEVNGKDAGKDLLGRLQPLPVKPASRCRKQTRSVTMEVIDKKTKKRAVIFDIDKILWRSETAADVEGGYVCASLCMAGGTYHVVWDGTRWVVTGFDIRVQS
jgi:hypothetical protein